MSEILNYSYHPAMLMALIIVIAWIWEDASLVYGALLAVDGKLSIMLSVTAIFLGICSGDLGLYYLGRLGHRWRRLRAWMLTNPRSRGLRRRFRRNTLTNIFLIRFVPGLRTLGFTLCGLWRIQMRRFMIAMTLAGIFWIAIIFSLVYQLGTTEWLENSHWKWSLMGIALFLLILNNVVANRTMRK